MSLLICVAVAGVWARSYAAVTWVSRLDGADELHALASRGELEVMRLLLL